MTTRAEIDGEMGDLHVGQLARLMSQAMRKLTAAISKSNCVAIFINQIREKIGVMYGNPETTTGGNALKFYASVRLDVRRVESIKEGGNVVGNHVRVKVVKNKVAPPFRQAEFDIMFGEGISKWGELVDMAVNFEIIQKAGSWFSMNGERIGQGKDSVKAFLMDNPEIADSVEEQVRAKLREAQQRPTSERTNVETADHASVVSAEDFNDD
jgi:recombination protein RecA